MTRANASRGSSVIGLELLRHRNRFLAQVRRRWVFSILPKIPDISVGIQNERARFGFFRPEYSGSPLEVVHLFRLEYSDRNSPFHF